jgi:menaquinone-dependent protoporphyrinogen oxidase
VNSTILVTYATRYGSTREAAEAIAARLASLGHATRVAPVGEARTLDGVGAVVLGTPIYLGAPLADAVRWLERWRPALERLPVAVFALGPTRSAEGTDGSRRQLDAALAKHPWLHPVAVDVFVGRYDPARFRIVDRLITALPASPLHGVPAHDERDRTALERWADGIVDRIAVAG